MKYLFGNQKTPMKWQSCTIYIYTKGKQSYWFYKCHLE